MTPKKRPLVPPGDIRRRYAKMLPDEEAAALELLFVLRETTHRVDAALANWLGPDALTPGRLQVLAVLWARDEAIPQRDIVAALKVSRPTVSDLVDALATEGHVSVEPDPKDRRQVLVQLTRAGHALTERLIRTNAKKLRAMFAVQDADALKALVNRLEGLLRAPSNSHESDA